MNNYKKGVILTLIAAISSIVASYRISSSLGLFETMWAYGIGLVTISVSTFLITYKFREVKWVVFPLVMLGMAIGVIVDVVLDFYLNQVDRNLFPFEIVIWGVMLPIPILVAILVKEGVVKIAEK